MKTNQLTKNSKKTRALSGLISLIAMVVIMVTGVFGFSSRSEGEENPPSLLPAFNWSALTGSEVWNKGVYASPLNMYSNGARKRDLPAPEIIFSGQYGLLKQSESTRDWYQNDLRFSFYPITSRYSSPKLYEEGRIGVYGRDRGNASWAGGVFGPAASNANYDTMYAIGSSGSEAPTETGSDSAFYSSSYIYRHSIDFKKPNTFGMMYINAGYGAGFTFSFLGANSLAQLQLEVGSSMSGLGAYPTHLDQVTTANANLWQKPNTDHYRARLNRYISNGVAVEIDGVQNGQEDSKLQKPGYNKNILKSYTSSTNDYTQSHVAIMKLGYSTYDKFMTANGNHNYYPAVEGGQVGPEFQTSTVKVPNTKITDRRGVYPTGTEVYRYLEVKTVPYEYTTDEKTGAITKVTKIAMQATVYYTNDEHRLWGRPNSFYVKPLISKDYILAQTKTAIVPMTDLEPKSGSGDTSYYWAVTSTNRVTNGLTVAQSMSTGASMTNALFLVAAPGMGVVEPGDINKYVKNETTEPATSETATNNNKANNEDSLVYTLEYTHKVNTSGSLNPWGGNETNLDFFTVKDTLDKRLILDTKKAAQYRIGTKNSDGTFTPVVTSLTDADGWGTMQNYIKDTTTSPPTRDPIWTTDASDNTVLNWQPNILGVDPGGDATGGTSTAPLANRVILKKNQTIQMRFYTKIDLSKGTVTVTGSDEKTSEVPYTDTLKPGSYTTTIRNSFDFVGYSNVTYTSEYTATVIGGADSLEYKTLYVRQVFRKGNKKASSLTPNLDKLVKDTLPIPSPGYVNLANKVDVTEKTETEKKDADGNIIYETEKDEDGKVVKDKDGNVVYKKDKDGNKIPEYESAKVEQNFTYYSPIVSYLYNHATYYEADPSKTRPYGLPSRYTKINVPIYKGKNTTKDPDKVLVTSLEQPTYYKYVGYILSDGEKADTTLGDLDAAVIDDTKISKLNLDRLSNPASVEYYKKLTDEEVTANKPKTKSYLTFIYEPVVEEDKEKPGEVKDITNLPYSGALRVNEFGKIVPGS